MLRYKSIEIERQPQAVGRHSMKFKIPYYAQSSEFTCGPACVLMIFKLFNSHLKLNRTLEFEVWRQCNMIGVRGADPFGMSVPLLDAGYEIHLVTQRRRMIDSDLWRHGLPEQKARSEPWPNCGVWPIDSRAGRQVLQRRVHPDSIGTHGSGAPVGHPSLGSGDVCWRGPCSLQ